MYHVKRIQYVFPTRRREKTNITTMAAATGNDPLVPLIDVEIPLNCVSIRSHMMPRASKYAFCGWLAGLNPLNAPWMWWWWQWISFCHWSILRDLDLLITGKNHILLIGAVSPICPTRHRVIFSIFCGARGHFQRWWPLWCGVVGCWPLALVLTSYIQVGIVLIYIPNVFLRV